MIFTIEKANLIADQLKKFTTGYTHHVVGQFANIDFWINESIQAIKVIDDHRTRFDSIRKAQKEWVEDHDIIVHDYCPICRGVCEFSNGKPSLPRLRYKNEKSEARRDLIDSTYFFLIRCYRIGLLSSEELKQKCDVIGTGIDLEDLK